MISENYIFCDVTLKSFSLEQSQALLDIRNDETVRRGMLNTEPISRDNHERWVKENVIENLRVHLFFLHYRNHIAGFSLLKALPKNQYEIGLMLKPQFVGTRAAFLSAIATAKYSFENLKNTLLISKVPKSNVVALDFNQRMGLVMHSSDEHCHFLKMTPAMFYQHKLIGQQLKKHSAN